MEVQSAFREVFCRWGLPERIRVDNGHPWGSTSDLPPVLALWLIGLGVGVIYNPVRRPQDNGMVERFHGLIEPWAEPRSCAGFDAWRERLDWLSTTQREHYPAIDGRSRAEAFPALQAGGRPYNPALEERCFDLERVRTYLSGGLWRRRVDKVGRITLYHRAYRVGRPYARQEVFVRFDPHMSAWVVEGRQGGEISRHAANEITTEAIMRLKITHYKPAARSKQCDTTP